MHEISREQHYVGPGGTASLQRLKCVVKRDLALLGEIFSNPATVRAYADLAGDEEVFRGLFDSRNLRILTKG